MDELKELQMKIEDIEDYSKNINGKIEFDYDISNLNWFNIGGKVKIFLNQKVFKN